VRAFFSLPAVSLSLRLSGFLSRRLAYVLDSLVRVTRRVVRIRFANGAARRGRERTAPSRRRRPPVSGTSAASASRDPFPLPPILPNLLAAFRGRAPSTGRDLVSLPRRRERRRRRTSIPTRCEARRPRVGTRPVVKLRRPTAAPERLARYGSNVRTPEADCRRQKLPAPVNGFVRFPFNDFKFF